MHRLALALICSINHGTLNHAAAAAVVLLTERPGTVLDGLTKKRESNRHGITIISQFSTVLFSFLWSKHLAQRKQMWLLLAETHLLSVRQSCLHTNTVSC